MLKALRHLASRFIDLNPLWGVAEAFGFGQCLAF